MTMSKRNRFERTISSVYKVVRDEFLVLRYYFVLELNWFYVMYIPDRY